MSAKTIVKFTNLSKRYHDLMAVNNLEKKVLSKDDIKSIIIEVSPWTRDSKQWDVWKLEIEKRIYALERDIQKIKEEKQ